MRQVTVTALAVLLVCASMARAEELVDREKEAVNAVTSPHPVETLDEQESQWRERVARDMDSPSGAKWYFGLVEAKLLRGTVNLLTSPADVAACAVQAFVGFTANRSLEVVAAAPVAFTEGAQHSVGRAVSGVSDLATFWMPAIPSLPAPRTYLCEALNTWRE